MISRRHAQIEVQGRSCFLTDLESTNGTRWGGNAVTVGEPVRLSDGDEFSLGPETIVRFEILVPATVRAADTPVSRMSVKTPRRPVRPDPLPAEATPMAERPIELDQVVSRPADRFGQFEVFEELAHSDADRVDRAKHCPAGAIVALKRFVSPTCTKSVRQAITAEIRRATDWQHPNIARMAEVGEHEGVLFVASEFVRGLTIRDIQARCAKNIDPALAGYIVRELCRAVAYIHDVNSGLAHGYIAPRAAIVGTAGEIKLINYGLPSYETRVLGKAHADVYRPHEARNGARLEERSDVCSLGFLLYELLTAMPIDARSRAVLREPDTLNPEIPPALSKVAWKATRLNASRRFSTVTEMESELSAALASTRSEYDASRVADWMGRYCVD